jgi:hypothetical protein
MTHTHNTGFHTNNLLTNYWGAQKGKQAFLQTNNIHKRTTKWGMKKESTKFENRNPYWSKALKNLKQWNGLLLLPKCRLLLGLYYYLLWFCQVGWMMCWLTSKECSLCVPTLLLSYSLPTILLLYHCIGGRGGGGGGGLVNAKRKASFVTMASKSIYGLGLGWLGLGPTIF